MVDLYAVLGVSRDADQKTIRRAFRKSARGAHPDGGGSVEAFNELRAAYDVLSDPTRRRRYDETGEFGEPNADPHRKKLIEILSLGLDQALLKLSSASKNDSDADLVRLMIEALATKRLEFSKQLSSFERARDDARRIEDRFLVAEGDNLMTTVVADRIAACENQIELLSERVKLIDEALTILHSTRFDAPLKLTSGQNHTYTYLDVSGLARTY